MIVAEILGPDALIVVVLAVILLFGADRLPRLARSLGEASRELKHGQGKSEAGSAIDGSAGSDLSDMSDPSAELEALLAQRDAQARRDNSDPGQGDKLGL
jgi:sec-independent protein translocase protein TatA